MQSPLDLPTVQVVGEHSTHPSLQASATASLGAYALAHQFSFTEAVACARPTRSGTASPSSGTNRYQRRTR